MATAGSLASRLLPRAILRSQPFGIDDEQIAFRAEAKGRPLLRVPPALDGVFDFNCSHDSSWVCCGFLHGAFAAASASARIGVDVMRLAIPFPADGPADLVDTLRDQLDGAELADVEACPERDRVARAIRYWAHKEAVVKATGEGIGAGLARYRVRLDDNDGDDAGPPTTLQRDGVVQPEWRFHERLLDDDHVLVLAVQAPGRADPETAPPLEPALRRLSLADLEDALS